jgi:hypothetical protein
MLPPFLFLILPISQIVFKCAHLAGFIEAGFIEGGAINSLTSNP